MGEEGEEMVVVCETSCKVKIKKSKVKSKGLNFYF